METAEVDPHLEVSFGQVEPLSAFGRPLLRHWHCGSLELHW